MTEEQTKETNRSEVMCLLGPDYRLGDQHPEIALMGACPGAQEEEQGRPFIGGAGTHLTAMIRIINAISPTKFPSENRDDYTLLNAHPLPRYEGRAEYDGNTEPTKLEVMSNVNIVRLNQQLRQSGIVRILLAGTGRNGLLKGSSSIFQGLSYLCVAIHHQVLGIDVTLANLGRRKSGFGPKKPTRWYIHFASISRFTALKIFTKIGPELPFMPGAGSAWCRPKPGTGARRSV